ncbi:MAG: glutamyl-tRNA reductase [Betaproteobacteria bacterium TMED156]|nr:MAG: glutamyl-tRNA reductase [Betaproteobacteria bacterium TMED156]
MGTELLAIGLNHQSASISLREKLAFPGEVLARALADARKTLDPLAPEQALLSTCNRTELYLAGNKADMIIPKAESWLSDYAKYELSDLKKHLYLHRNNETVRHIFRVASGLDSMVLGEPQILGQVKLAARQAHASGNLGTNLHHLFQRAFFVAKDVRSNTEIGSQSVSIAAASVKIAQQIFGNLSETKILFIGAGDMIQLCLPHYIEQNPIEIVIANRNIENSRPLAKSYGGSTVSLGKLHSILHQFDVIISCTASTLPIVGLGMVQSALKKRRNRPFVLIDLAIPRDIEPEIQMLDNVFIYSLDDIGKLVHRNLENRHSAIAKAEEIIEANVLTFEKWKAGREQIPLIKQLAKHSEVIQENEVSSALKKLTKNDTIENVLKSLARGISQKYLHGAYHLLQSETESSNEEVAKWVKKIYRLNPSYKEDYEKKPDK